MDRRIVEVLIEIPLGGRNKYEYDRDRKLFVLDRVLYSSVHYPTDYGFILDTLAPDGDPLDALVVTTEPTFPGCLVPAIPIGMLEMHDEKGEDFKVLAVPAVDPRWSSVRELSELPAHWLLEIENFFRTYKTLEGVDTEVVGWKTADAAWETIERSRDHAGPPADPR